LLIYRNLTNLSYGIWSDDAGKMYGATPIIRRRRTDMMGNCTSANSGRYS
jgi:hypothetical protein